MNAPSVMTIRERARSGRAASNGPVLASASTCIAHLGVMAVPAAGVDITLPPGFRLTEFFGRKRAGLLGSILVVGTRCGEIVIGSGRRAFTIDRDDFGAVLLIVEPPEELALAGVRAHAIALHVFTADGGMSAFFRQRGVPATTGGTLEFSGNGDGSIDGEVRTVLRDGNQSVELWFRAGTWYEAPGGTFRVFGVSGGQVVGAVDVEISAAPETVPAAAVTTTHALPLPAASSGVGVVTGPFDVVVRTATVSTLEGA
jgi:hypothetical protein